MCRATAPHRLKAARREDGTAVLEFALVTIALLLLLYGIVTYGIVFAVEQTLTHAAAEGARAAVGTTAEEAAAESITATTDAVGWLSGHVEPSDISTTVVPCANDPAVDCVEVTIDYPYRERPVVPPLPLVGFAVPGTIRTEATASLGG